MSVVEIVEAIEEWRIDDELAEAPGFCRRSAIKMKRVAEKANQSKPTATIEYLVFPKATTEENVHYAVHAYDKDQDIIFNTSPTPTCPQYIGPRENAPGKLIQMIPTEEVR